MFTAILWAIPLWKRNPYFDAPFSTSLSVPSATSAAAPALPSRARRVLRHLRDRGDLRRPLLQVFGGRDIRHSEPGRSAVAFSGLSRHCGIEARRRCRCGRHTTQRVNAQPPRCRGRLQREFIVSGSYSDVFRHKYLYTFERGGLIYRP